MTPPSVSAPLAVRGLSAGYGKTVVLPDLSLEMRPGEILGLIGLNGVGKTTLIKAILGLGQAEGEVALFNEPASRPDSRRHLAYLPEKFTPSPLLKGWEFLSLTLAYYGLPLDRDKARDLCRGLDFDPAALDRQGRTYSKGMGQKLGLVGTLLTGRPLLVLDEPMSGLDPRSRIALKDRLTEARAAGCSIFFSSHILSDIEEICDRIAVMHKGRLIYVGAPAPFVAQHDGHGLERAFLRAIEAAEQAA